MNTGGQFRTSDTMSGDLLINAETLSFGGICSDSDTHDDSSPQMRSTNHGSISAKARRSHRPKPFAPMGVTSKPVRLLAQIAHT